MESHRFLHRGLVDTSSLGDALVKIFVDDAGHVRRAVLLDAGDKYLGAAALKAARNTTYLPDRSSGQRQAFEAEFMLSQWSKILFGLAKSNYKFSLFY